MKTIYKVISLLLSYPSAELQAEIPSLIDALKASRDGQDDGIERIADLARDIESLDLYDAQERYVYLFDRTRSLSLHLFEHVHGESRDRGQAMVDLGQMYDDAGLAINAKELPDYLPLFLEFLSMVPEQEAAELLEQISHILVVLGARLNKRDSIYANAFNALADMASGNPDQEIVDDLLARDEDDPTDLNALDQVWKEDPVTFGGNVGDQSCGLDRIRVQARALSRKPTDPGDIRTNSEVNP